MPRPLKAYGAAIMLLVGEREALGLRPHIRQGRGVIAATSLTAASRALGVSRDYVSETGNARDIADAMAYPGRVVVRPSSGRSDAMIVREAA